VLRLVLNEGATIAGMGTVLGFLGAFAISRLLSAVTNVVVEALRVGTSDSLLLLVVPLLLCGSAMVACYVPARRAARIDPLRALREE
jgi:putative ABC transport system permease protein